MQPCALIQTHAAVLPQSGLASLQCRTASRLQRRQSLAGQIRKVLRAPCGSPGCCAGCCSGYSKLVPSWIVQQLHYCLSRSGAPDKRRVSAEARRPSLLLTRQCLCCASPFRLSFWLPPVACLRVAVRAEAEEAKIEEAARPSPPKVNDSYAFTGIKTDTTGIGVVDVIEGEKAGVPSALSMSVHVAVYCTVLYCTVPVLYCTVLYCTGLEWTGLDWTALDSIVLSDPALILSAHCVGSVQPSVYVNAVPAPTRRAAPLGSSGTCANCGSLLPGAPGGRAPWTPPLPSASSRLSLSREVGAPPLAPWQPSLRSRLPMSRFRPPKLRLVQQIAILYSLHQRIHARRSCILCLSGIGQAWRRASAY